MRKKRLFIFIIVALIISYLHIDKIKLNIDIENPIECYIEALPSIMEINECSSAILKKEIEVIDDFKVK